MNITRLAIEKNRVTGVALLVIAAAGIAAYFSAPRAEDPGFIIRMATVFTAYPGAGPERVEQLVTDKLEKAIQEIPELDFVFSESKTGASVIFVNIEERYRHMRPIWDKLRRKVEKARAELPATGIIGPVVNDEFGDVFGILINLTGDGFSYRELKEVADEVRNEFLLLDLVAKVEIYGAQEERIFVEYSNARLAEIGLSPLQLRSVLEAQNIIIPGGAVSTEFEKITLEPSGNFETVEDVKRTVIQLPGRADLVFLEDVADVYRGYIDPPETKARASGVPGLVLAISMREGGNIIQLGEEVRSALARIEAFYPIGVEFDIVQFQPDAVDQKISDFIGNLLQAIAIVCVVMLLFLGIRTGLVVASLIPMAMLMALMVMGLLDIGLDQMSIASLIIALGMLVDNAIVMSESIMVQMEEGKPPVQAAVDSARELRIPLLTSSATTAAAFLVIFLAESSTGEYTAPLFKVVTITLLSSWILALTMIPLLSAKFLRVKKERSAESFDTPAYRRYRGLLLTLLRRPWQAVAGAVIVFFLAVQLFRFVPVMFFPPHDRPTFTAEIELPTGSPIERTELVVSEIEAHIEETLRVGEDRESGIINWASFIGEGAPRFILSYAPEMAAPSYGFMLINATSRESIPESIIPSIERFAEERFPDLKATIRPLDLGPPSWPPVAVRVSGPDVDVLFRIAERVKEKLAAIPGTRLIDDDWGPMAKKVRVEIDQPRARRAGVTSQDVAISLQSYLSGIETTEYREGDEIIPVTLRSVAGGRSDLGKIESINVYAQSTGRSVPLTQVANVELEWEAAKVVRRNRMRTVTVEAGTAPGVTAAEVNAQLVPWLASESADWGLGYRWELGGEAETSEQANASIMAKLPIAGLIIILLLVSQFNSIRKPLIILITIPMGIIGVVIGLLVARSFFGFMTLLGIIALSGIVINNAIVLLDRIRIEIEDHGRPANEAVIEAAQRRVRPILLTTITTMGGLVPLWFGGGPMWEPMAVSIIFGLAFATVLTLGFVPVLYSLFYRVSFREYRYR
jgi:multidrug efflux pump subunit AcrB